MAVLNQSPMVVMHVKLKIANLLCHVSVYQASITWLFYECYQLANDAEMWVLKYRFDG